MTEQCKPLTVYTFNTAHILKCEKNSWKVFLNNHKFFFFHF